MTIREAYMEAEQTGRRIIIRNRKGELDPFIRIDASLFTIDQIMRVFVPTDFLSNRWALEREIIELD